MRNEPRSRVTALPRRVAVLLATLLSGELILWGAQSAKPLFGPDDPAWKDRDDVHDASGAKPQELSQYYDFLENSFATRGDRRDIPAMNLNSLDEVPDSSWFTNRIVRQPMSPLSDEEIARGPDRVERLTFENWVIVRDKGSGAQPGFRAISPDDPTKHLYQLEVDPPENPEMATGAEIIGTAIYHALGYNVVDVYLVTLDPARIQIAPDATLRDRAGRQRRFERRDLDDVLRRAARMPDGRYRALASRFADGQPMGQFRYYGTRPDDPNDVYPHEHRRELRANRVFGAWLNHDDSRANNTLDMLVGPEGSRYIKHYMFDFGSILGSGTTDADTARSGHGHIVERSNWKTLLSFGLLSPEWAKRPVPDVTPAVGRFDSAEFDPHTWKAEYPNVAFSNMRQDDAFWGARRVAAFSDRVIRRVVEKAAYTDPRATDYIVKTLVERRDRIAGAWLTGVTPIVDPRLSDEGVLTFENAATTAGVATSSAKYTIAWSIFDNNARQHQTVGPAVTTEETRSQAPQAILNASTFVCATIRVFHADYPRWNDPVELYFRREGTGWRPIGLLRVNVNQSAKSSF
jgi:hypothetical protein